MLHDLRYALRSLRKTPGFAIVVIVSLALGIGANSAMFSLADGILLRPMPVKDPSGVMVVQSQLKGESLAGVFQFSQMSYPDYVDLRNRSKSFTGLSISNYMQFGFAKDKDQVPQMKFGVIASGNFFDVLELKPAAGRFFRADEAAVPGRDSVIVLGYDLWKNDFSGSPDAIGKTIYLNGVAFTVIGVAPQTFNGPHAQLRSAMYVPLMMVPQLTGDANEAIFENRGRRDMFVHGRLKPGVSIAQAAAETKVIGEQLAQAYPKTNKTCSLVLSTELKARVLRNPADVQLLTVLLTLAAIVLIIACANVMNLMLSRGRARAREMAIRLAIGAGRGHLIRQLFTESVLIAVLGGALGLLVANLGVDLFSQIRIPGDMPIVVDFRLDTRVLLFTVLASFVSAVLFGILPAIRSTRPELTPALKSGGLAGEQRNRFIGRNILVILQVAGSLLLIIFATQAYRGGAIVLSEPGFRTDHVLTASFDPSLARSTQQESDQFYKRLLDSARTLPGVKAAALTQAVPMIPGGGQRRVVPEGYQFPAGTEAATVITNPVTPEYFKVVDIPIVDGREFTKTDKGDAPKVAIVNEHFAHKYFPNQSAVGKRLWLDARNGTFVQIVGIAKQSKYMFPVEPPFDFVYWPLAQNKVNGLTLMLYTEGPPSDAAAPLRVLVHSIDASQPIVSVRTMDDVYEQRATGTLGIILKTMAGLGVLGLVLAMVGLYGLMTYSVGLRRREIGIRMAIGADRGSVLTMVLRQGMLLAVIGVAIGCAAWLVASKPVMAVVEAQSFSWSLLVLTVFGLLATAALGTYIPARRASLVDPNKILRQD